MHKLLLGLAFHNHQPLGNFPWVFEEAYQRAYFPMLEALGRHPSVSVSLHYSGCLIDWLKAVHPEFFRLLARLCARGQVELMGGAYYEPILSMIPDSDRWGQIGKMSEFIRTEFGSAPSGMWLAERVWEPALAGILADCGIAWTLVDDTAFKMVGKEEKELEGYFLTEDTGKYLKVFPISKYLRYAIPWHDTMDIIKYLREISGSSGQRLIVMGDDGEKFGVWPETYEHCWQNGWVDNFFRVIEENADWIETVKLGEYATNYPPSGRIYLPCASYDEMMEWSLPADLGHALSLRRKGHGEDNTTVEPYLKAGFWRNFLVKYPEANRMQKRMLRVHAKIMSVEDGGDVGTARDFLWRAQCNCPYWHGVFGGLYLADIRAEAYSNLIRAENVVASLSVVPRNTCSWTKQDFDGDGKDEIIVESEIFSLYFSPSEGGTLFEWDLHDKTYNVLNSVARRPEAYHKDFGDLLDNAGPSMEENIIHSIHDAIRVKAGDYIGELIYDRLPRSSMLDHFLPSNAGADDFENNRFKEGGDFAGCPYEFIVRDGQDFITVEMRRTADVLIDSRRISLTVEKSITAGIGKRWLGISYAITNNANDDISAMFASEWNINLLAGGHNQAAYCMIGTGDAAEMRADSRGEMHKIGGLLLGNRQLGIELNLELDRPLDVWRFPVESLSNSEGGVEKVYQCTCIVILMPLQLARRQQVAFNYAWNISR